MGKGSSPFLSPLSSHVGAQDAGHCRSLEFLQGAPSFEHSELLSYAAFAPFHNDAGVLERPELGGIFVSVSSSLNLAGTAFVIGKGEGWEGVRHVSLVFSSI